MAGVLRSDPVLDVPGPSGAAAARAWQVLVRDPITAFTALAGEFGPAVRVPYAPGRAAYLLSGADHAEHVLVANQANYRKAFTYRPLRMVLGDGLLTSEGATWEAHRRIISPVFARRHLDPFVPDIAIATSGRLASWRSGAVLDVAAEMRRVTLDIVGRTLFGAALADEADELGRVLAQLQANNLLGAGLAVLPGRFGETVLANARRMPVIGPRIRRLDAFVETMISARRTAAGDEENLLDLLIAHSAGPDGLTDRDLHDEVLTLVLAGHETTAAALSWTLAELSRHPEVREQVAAEAVSVLGPPKGTTAVTADDVDRLEWSRAVLQESMRLHPPAWTIERESIAADVVAGVPLPAGATVAVPPYLIHRNRDLWPDPSHFDPTRFVGVHERPRYAYLPFGAGRRICVGSAFALMEATLVLAMIAREHRLDLVEGFPRGRAEVTLRPSGPMPMRLSPR